MSPVDILLVLIVILIVVLVRSGGSCRGIVVFTATIAANVNIVCYLLMIVTVPFDLGPAFQVGTVRDAEQRASAARDGGSVAVASLVAFPLL